MSERERLEQAIAALEAQRALLGNAAVDAALAGLRQELAELERAARARRPRAKPSSFAGERKWVTIVFADLSGFTPLAETMDPEAVRDLMNACFEQLVPIIERYGGTVDKFIGDQVMALFGAPVAHENDPERALRAVLEMREAMAAFDAGQRLGLGVHFGVNSGLVIAGGIGTQGRQEYSVMGDAVNLASRLEDASGEGEILVGLDTRRLAEAVFEFEALEPIQVKGKAEPVPVYRLLGPRAVPGRRRSIAGMESPLVGRQAEFRALQEALHRLGAGEGGIVTVVGEAGLGKSRLVAELRQEALERGDSPVQWVEGRCLSYGISIAYLLWLDVLRGLLGTTAESSPASVRDRLRERVQALCPDHFAETYPYLGRLMALPLEPEIEATLCDLEGEHLKAGTFQAIERLLECAGRQQPLVIVGEDLQWADPTSIELLERLLALTERAPLLFICLFRPEREQRCWHIWETAAALYHQRHTDLRLESLSNAESEQLIGNLLPLEELPVPLKERILGRAEGNPFYVEEIIRSLVDSGAIARDPATGRWQATGDVAGIAIPDTLQRVLTARIDRLEEETKRILQMAAVIGRIFLYRVLAEIAREERALDQHLGTLQQEEMIRERERLPELEYIFKHHLTQEVAYDGLLKKERRAFHRQVAEGLERLFPDRIEEQVGLLAHHWARAEEPEKATAYLLRAGDQARLAYAHEEAIDAYEGALAFSKDQEDCERAARTLMKIGLTYHNAFDFSRARQAYEEGFALWRQAGEMEPAALPPAPHSLRVHCALRPQTLDPALATEGESFEAVDQLFSGLVESTPEMDIVPGIARSWEVSAGGRRYIFHLREDVRWSDGRPVTATDFAYAWQRVLDPATGSCAASLLYDIQGARAFHQGESSDPECLGVHAPDPHTLVVELERPAGYFLQLLATTATYPVPRHAVEAWGEAWCEASHIVTNGPFNLVDWQRDRLMVLEHNPAYHGRCSGNVQRVELFSLEWPAALEAYDADSLDILHPGSLPLADMDRARQRHGGEFISCPWVQTGYLGFDVGQPPFDDARVRQAFVMASDRERVADVTMRGYQFAASGGFVPPGIPGHSPGIGLPYDPERARRLLAEAGYPAGRGFPQVVLLSPADTLACDVGQNLQAQWREVLGVEVAWESEEWTALYRRMEERPPHMFLQAWFADYPDPDNFLRVGFPQEWTHWQNEAYGRLVEEARSAMDQEERMRLYRQADRILVEEAPIAPLLHPRAHLLVKPWVKKHPASAANWWFWKDVVIEPH